MHTKILPPKSIEFINLPEIWRYRSLFGTLALRDIKRRYRQTLLGVVWVIIQPLFTSAVFAVIFGRFGNLPSGEVPYWVNDLPITPGVIQINLKLEGNRQIQDKLTHAAYLIIAGEALGKNGETADFPMIRIDQEWTLE